MKYIPLIILFLVLVPVVKAQTLKEEHAEIEVQDKIVRGVFSRGDIKDSPISEIGLERTFWYGMCPAYLVRISSDGTVTCESIGHIERHGRHTGNISPYQLRSLFAYINKSSFFEMQDTYTYPVTDHPTSYTLVVKEGKEKVVKISLSLARLNFVQSNSIWSHFSTR